MKTFADVAWRLVLIIVVASSLRSETRVVNRSPEEAMLGPMADMINQSDEPQETEYDRLIRIAVDRMENGNPRSGFKMLNEALALEPNNIRAYLAYGRAHIKLGEFEAAARALDKALELDPRDDRVLYYKGILEFSYGDMDTGVKYITEAIKYDVNNYWLYYSTLGDALYRMGKYEEAIPSYEGGIGFLKQNLERLSDQIRIEGNQMELTDVREEIEYSARYNPATGRMEIVEIPVTRLISEMSGASAELVAERSDLSSSLRRSLYRMGICQLELGKVAVGKELIRESFLEKENDLYRGLYSVANRDYNNAVDLLAVSSRKNRAPIECVFGYLIGQLSEGNKAGASKALKRLKKRIKKENAVWAWDALAYMEELVPEIELAKREKASSLNDEDAARSAFYKAQLHFVQGYPELAEPFLVQATQISKDSSFEVKAARMQRLLLGES